LAREIYADRGEAGGALAAAVKHALAGEQVRPLVLAIPRGGVPVALEVARVLKAELDLVVPRKLGAEGNREFAIGSVMPDGTTYLNRDALALASTSDDDDEYIQKERVAEMKEASRRLTEYRGGRRAPEVSGRTVIVVDDGVATGATMIAALRWARAQGAGLLVAAAPVAPKSTADALKREADQVVCPSNPEPFNAIGAFYRNFDPVTDKEVIDALEGYWSSAGRGS
jgi:putative phosphoribosyl transferase